MWIIKTDLGRKTFQVIEPSFYDELDPCDDFTIKCLVVLKRKLPAFLGILSSFEFYLIRYGDFLGNQFAAIGIECKSNEEFKSLPDFIALYNQVELIINDLGVDNIKKEAVNIETITWKQLQKDGWYK